MSCTLYYLTYRVMAELGIVLEGTASTTSTGTLVDSSNRTESDDYWNSGTVYLFTSGSPAAKTGELYGVTDFTGTLFTAVLSNTLAPVSSGQAYGISKRRYPRNLVIQKINQAIEEIGNITRRDVSLTGVADTYTYTLPVAANIDLRQIWVQSDDDDEIYIEMNPSQWRVEESNTPGSAASLIFDVEVTAGRTIKLVYVGLHPRLTASTDVLDDQINEERVIYRAVRNCLLWRKQKTGGTDDLTDQLNYYNTMIERADILSPARIAHRKPKKNVLI